MRVVGVEEFGGPEKLRVFEVDETDAGPGEIRIRVHAAAVNPTDAGLRAGAYGKRLTEGRQPPYVPGMDAAGVVDQLGEGAAEQTGLALGDRVMAIVVPLGSHGGAYAEKIVVPARSVVAVPAGSSFAEACTLPMNGLTTRLAFDLLGLQAGQSLAITGAAGAVGGYGIELAKMAGIRVLADASEADEQLVKGMGADVVVRRGDDVADRFLGATPGGVDAVLDAALIGSKVLPAVKDGGAVAAVRIFEGETERGITVHQVLVTRYATEREKLDDLRRAVEEGKVTLRVAEVLPAAQAAEAHRRLAEGGTRGRFVLEF